MAGKLMKKMPSMIRTNCNYNEILLTTHVLDYQNRPTPAERSPFTFCFGLEWRCKVWSIF